MMIFVTILQLLAALVLIGIVLFFIIGCEFFINYQVCFRKKQKEA